MATKVIMPALGMAQETGIVMAWLKQEGEQVVAGEPLLEVETDKATAELEAPASGILAGVTAHAGDEVPVAETIAWILVSAEEALPITTRQTPPTAVSTPTPTPLPETAVAASPVAARMAADHEIVLADIANDGRRITKADVEAYLAAQQGQPRLTPASPKARRLAAEQGVALTEIDGSGPDGAVVAEDVETAVAHQQPLRKTDALLPAAQPETMSKTWRSMANRLAEAWQTVPHFYLVRECDATQLVAWRDAAQRHTDTKITYTDLLTKAVAAALQRHPRVNAAWIKNTIFHNDAIHVGLAVATDDGLIVPVIPHTNTLTVAEIADQRQGIVSRALAGKLKANDLQGGTFTVSNLGMYGIDRFNAIVNPPQAAILAVGKIAEKVVPVAGEPHIRPMMTMTLSADHRVVDGARGAAFLNTLVTFLEQPVTIL